MATKKKRKILQFFKRKKHKSDKKKMAFSKKGWIANTVIVCVVSVVAITHSFVTGYVHGDSTIYTFLIPACWAELGVYSAFLLKKSEKENTKGGIVYDSAMKDSSGSNSLE